MKRIFSLTLILAMILSCFTIVANASAPTFTLSSNGADTGAIDDIFEVSVTLTGTNTLSFVRVNLSYDKNVVKPLKKDESAIVTSGNYVAQLLARHNKDKGEAEDGEEYNLWANEKSSVSETQFGAESNKGFLDYTFAMNGDWADYDVKVHNIDDPYIITTIKFKRVATGDANFALEAADKALGVSGQGLSVDGDTNIVPEVVIDIANPGAGDEGDDEEVPGTNDVLAEFYAPKSEASKTITLIGKVKADKQDLAYGVEVNNKKFFGAKVGDMVSSDGTEANFGNTEVAFGDSSTWSGEFEIILTGIKADTTSASCKYFVGDVYTDAAVIAIAE